MRFISPLVSVATSLFDLISPAECLCCRTRLTQNTFVCANCNPWHVSSRVSKNPLAGIFESEASDSSPFRSFFCYDTATEAIIKALKYGGRDHLVSFLASQMKRELDPESLGGKFGLVTAVPSSPSRVRKRGFAHTSLIARELAKHFQTPFSYRALRAKGERPPQASLPLEKRRKNIRNAFVADKSLVENKTILVFDDIITSGASAAEAVRALQQANARLVTVLTLARSSHFHEACITS